VRPGRAAACFAGLWLAPGGSLPAFAREPIAPLRGIRTSPVPTAPLAPGEQLFELSALGVATANADRAVITFTIQGEARDFEEAQRRFRARLAELRARLRALGLPADAVRDADSEPPGTIERPLMLTGATPDDFAVGTAVVVRTDPALVAAVNGVLDAMDINDMGQTVYSLSDPASVLRAARLDALSRVRARAEAWAAANNLRVVRLVRLSERNATDFSRAVRSEGRILRRGEGASMLFNRQNSVVIDLGILVGAEFALAPR
jgi:uncharacterized protein YggE